MIPDYIASNEGLDDMILANAEMDPRDDELSNEVVCEIVQGCVLAWWLAAGGVNVAYPKADA
jgi:hypothetical protein